MKLRKISAAVLTALTAVSICSFTAFAEQANEEQPSPAETSATEAPVTQSTEEQPTETTLSEWQPTQTTTTTAAPVSPTEPATTTTTTTYEAPEPTSTPATISLKISEVKDKKFTADIMVDCPKKIANAQFSIEYDELMLKYEGCTNNDEAGGMAVENSFDGKFVYNYVNPEGTNYTGSYCTVEFSIIDDKLTSTVLYLTVNDLSDDKAVTISCQTENGILKYQTADPEDESSYREVRLKLSDSPFTADDLIAAGDIVKIDIEDSSVLVYEDELFEALKAGSTKVTIEYADASVARLNVIIEDDESSSAAETAVTTTAASSIADKTDSKKTSPMMFILIGLVVLLGAGLVFGEYYFLVKKRSAAKADDDEFDEDEYYDDED